MGVGGFPPPKLQRCPGHAGAENVPAFPSLSPLVLGILPPGSSARLPWTGRTCGMSAALSTLPRFYSSISPLLFDHVVLSCALPIIQPPSRPCTLCTAPVSFVYSGRRISLPSYVTRTPPQTGSPPPGMVSRPCRLYSQNYSTGPPYQTGRPGY